MDEKTGIQALGRTEERAPDSKGRCKRKEFEYVRNGTTGLMAAIDVGKGRIVQQMLHPTHTSNPLGIHPKALLGIKSDRKLVC